MNKKAASLILILLVSCNLGSDFYSYYSREDLWRLPLIEPYELINLKGASRNNQLMIEWQLDLLETKDVYGRDHLNVHKVQVQKGIIFGYGFTPPSKYFVIDSKTKSEYMFDSVPQWANYLKQYSIDTSALLDVWDVFLEFKDDKKLPWKSEIK